MTHVHMHLYASRFGYCTYLPTPYLGTRPPRELVQRNTSVYLSLLSPPISPGASVSPRTKERYSVKVADTSSKLLECFDTSSRRRARVDLNFLQSRQKWTGLTSGHARLYLAAATKQPS